MKLDQYRIETLRTMPDLGSKILNSLHMTIGIMTEIGEIAEALSEPSEGGIDMVNLSEELCGDIPWYLANYANIHDLFFPKINPDNIHVHDDESQFCKLVQYGGELLDFDKKSLAYNKPVNEFDQALAFDKFYRCLRINIKKYDLDFEEGLERNIAKLRQRFPKNFTSDKAINRDLDAERKILEGDLDIVQLELMGFEDKNVDNYDNLLT